jgi:large subunit ribosomal protein L9
LYWKRQLQQSRNGAVGKHKAVAADAAARSPGRAARPRNTNRVAASRALRRLAMEVILFEDVKNLGRHGEVVKVSEGYFRNFLKPKGLADVATPAARKRYEGMKKKAVQLAAEKRAEAGELAKRLNDLSITVKAKAGEGEKLFGSITTQEIADALKDEGYLVDKKQIEIDEHIKTLGPHKVKIRLHTDVHGEFTLQVERL